MKKSQLFFAIALLLSVSVCALGQTDKDYKKFFRYINANRADKVTKMIDKGKNMNSFDASGKTPLLYSLERDRSNIADLLITSGADLNFTDLEKNGSLHYAIEHCSNTDIVITLLDNGADLNTSNVQLYTPFHYSLLYKCPDLPFALLDRGADYSKFSMDEEGPIHLAVESGCETMVDHFIQQGLEYDNPDIFGRTPYLTAMENNHKFISAKLLDRGANVHVMDSSYHTPVFYAVTNNDTVIFERLLLKNAEVDVRSDGVTPILIAASRDNRYFVEKLLLNGAVNPMNCNVHDECYNTAFIYSVSAQLANEQDKMGLYQNSLNIYKLAQEKYTNELNKIRAKNTAKCCGQGMLIVAAAMVGYIYIPGTTNYETARRDYLKERLEKCDQHIFELEQILNPTEV